MLNRRREQGLTLIELMIGLLLGLIVTGIAISMYVSTLGITGQTVRTVMLNQELRLVLELVTADIRRAGHWDGSVGADNPHAEVVSGATKLLPISVFDNDGDGVDDCVILTYDYDKDGASDPEHIFGFRYNAVSGSVSSLEVTNVTSGAAPVTCGTYSGWLEMTDSRSTKITEFSFDISPSPVASWAESSSKEIEVTIVGESRSDDRLSRGLVESVRVRNEY